MIDIEKLKQAALISNGEPMLISASEVLDLINRLEAAESQQVAQELVIQQLRDALEKITQFASVQICSHDETYRGGNIWEICSQCGAEWADGEGGKPEFVEPKQITEAIKALAIPTSTVHLEAWYKEQVGEPVAYMQISVEEGVDTKFPRDHLPKKYNKEWWKFEPLHAIKPFPFKEK